MDDKKETKGHPRNVIATDFSDLESSYANQSFIQRTDDDIAFVFGQNTLGADGKVKIEFQNMIRMTHKHFKNFVANCNSTLKELEKNESK